MIGGDLVRANLIRAADMWESGDVVRSSDAINAIAKFTSGSTKEIDRLVEAFLRDCMDMAVSSSKVTSIMGFAECADRLARGLLVEDRDWCDIIWELIRNGELVLNGEHIWGDYKEAVYAQTPVFRSRFARKTKGTTKVCRKK